MGTITKLNDIVCSAITKVNDIVKSGITYFDDNSFCPSGPTPTPTPTPTATPTPTPTPTPCPPTCCEVLLCYGRDCFAACACNNQATFFLHIPCVDNPCTLGYADGIFEDSNCTTPASASSYTDGNGECYFWDGTTLTSIGPC
jgi:hypothetical protein